MSGLTLQIQKEIEKIEDQDYTVRAVTGEGYIWLTLSLRKKDVAINGLYSEAPEVKDLLRMMNVSFEEINAMGKYVRVTLSYNQEGV